jgi:hypothetical protein
MIPPLISKRAIKRHHTELISRAHTQITDIAKQDQSTPDAIVDDTVHMFKSTFPRIFQLLTDNEIDMQLVVNITNMMLDLPQHAHLKKPLLSYLAKNIDVNEIANKFNVGMATVKAALNSKYDPANTDLMNMYPNHVKRQKLCDIEQEAIKDFIISRCPVKSGSRRIRYNQYETTQDLYNEYSEALEMIIEQVTEDACICDNKKTTRGQYKTKWDKNIELHKQNRMLTEIRQELLIMTTNCIQSPLHKLAKADTNHNYEQIIDIIISFVGKHRHLSPRAAHTFSLIKSQLPVTRIISYFGQFDCEICASIPKLERDATNNPHDQNLQNLQQKAVTHTFIRHYQKVKYAQMRSNLTPTQILVAQDFGTLSVQPNISLKGKTMEYVTNLVLVLEYKNKDDDKKYNRKYIDIICEDDETRGADYFYVREAWNYLFNNTNHFNGFTEIIIWSDGGAAHFKQVYTQHFFSTLSQIHKKRISYHFWASYHGHGLHDSHITHNKRAIEKYLLSHEGERDLAYDQKLQVYTKISDTTPIRSVSELQRVLLDSYTNPTATSFRTRRTTRSISPSPYVSYFIYHLPSVDRTPSLKPDLKSLSKGTHKFHCFEYDEEDVNVVYTSDVSWCVLNPEQHPRIKQLFVLNKRKPPPPFPSH